MEKFLAVNKDYLGIGLKSIDILVLSQIEEFYRNDADCYITNKQFSDMFGESESTIKRVLDKLEELCIIKRNTSFINGNGRANKRRVITINDRKKWKVSIDTNYCVYKHTFPDNKIYIGITGKKPELRWGKGGAGYLGKNKDGTYNQPRIANAILKYGWENVEHEILFDGLTKNGAEQKEIELIAKYQSNNVKFGYNIESGGDTTKYHLKKAR